MKLSMSMVESRLTAYEVESDIQEDERTIRGMRFISEQQTEFSRDYIYIGRAAEYLEDALFHPRARRGGHDRQGCLTDAVVNGHRSHGKLDNGCQD